MEGVKEFVECLNTHWITMVLAGIYTHIREICIIGLCFEGPPFHPTYPSLLFTFSVLSVLAEYKPWPRSLKEPPTLLLYFYEVLVAALVTNLSTRAIWLPLMNIMWSLTRESSKWLLWVNTSVGMDRYSHMAGVADWMVQDESSGYMAWCTAILSFLWMLDATESLDAILDYMSTKILQKLALVKKLFRKKIAFQEPVVTALFVYDTAGSQSLMTNISTDSSSSEMNLIL